MADAPILGSTKKLTLDDDVFGAEFNGPLVHEVVVAELAARRRGTHSTRNRSMVRGGGAKPWRQKGTGRARQGSIRAPHFAGGGVVFGPTPRHYIVKVNRKARRAALRCALSIHADRGSVFGLDAGGFDVPSTKKGAELLADRRGGSVLIVLSGPGRGRGLQVLPQPRRRQRAGRRRLRRGRPRRRRQRRLQRGRARVRHQPCTEGGGCLMDHSQVIIRPVVSEKSYALATVGKYTFRVHPDAHKTQIKQAVEAAVRRRRARSPHLVRAVEAQAPRLHRRPHARVEEGRRAGARGRHDPDLPGPGGGALSHADPQAQAHLARPALRDLPGLLGDHEDRAGEDPRRGPQEVRRPQRQRPQDVAPPRRRRQAPVPQDRLQAQPQGRRAGQGRRDRVRPEPVGLHRAAALRRRREELHPRAQPPARRHDRAVGRRLGHHGRQRDAAAR